MAVDPVMNSKVFNPYTFDYIYFPIMKLKIHKTGKLLLATRYEMVTKYGGQYNTVTYSQYR